MSGILHALTHDDPTFVHIMQQYLLGLSNFLGMELAVPFYWRSRGGINDQRTFNIIGDIRVGTQHGITLNSHTKSKEEDYQWYIHTHINKNPSDKSYMPPSRKDILMTLHNAVNDVHGNRGGLSLILEPQGTWFICATDELVRRIRKNKFNIELFLSTYEERYFDHSTDDHTTDDHSTDDHYPRSICKFLKDNHFISDFIPTNDKNRD